MGGKSRTVEEIVAAIAGDAHGVVTRAELRAAGVSARQIDRRIANGALIPEYTGVYRAGHCAPSTEARYMAAVRACGEGAVLCGKAAAYLLGLLKSPFPPQPEVMTPTERKRRGVKTKRARTIDRRDVTAFHDTPRYHGPPDAR